MVQENPELTEGTIHVKQEGRAGKKIELVRIFTVENQEISREVLSTKVEEALPRIVEKGTKKAVAASEAPQSARKESLRLRLHYQNTMGIKRERLLPLKQLKDQNIQAPKQEQLLNPSKLAPLPEYQGTQAGAIVEPEQVEPEVGGVQSGAGGTRNS